MMACCTDDCTRADCVQLTQPESSVCNVICGSREPMSFGSLKEATSLHQEILSRIVRRLVVHGLVSKTDDGYLGDCGR